MRLGVLLAAALAVSAVAGPLTPRGYDKDFPNSYSDRDVRQWPLNDLLRRRGFPYRVYRSLSAGYFIVAEKKPDRTVGSVAWAFGDPARGPALAFGSQRRSPEDRQRLLLVNALWVLQLPGSEIYTSAYDPYKPVGRLDLKAGTLVFDDRDRFPDLLSWLTRNRKDAPEVLASAEKALADALHSDGGDFRGLEAVQRAGHWVFAVRTSKSRVGAPLPPFFSD